MRLSTFVSIRQLGFLLMGISPFFCLPAHCGENLQASVSALETAAVGDCVQAGSPSPAAADAVRPAAASAAVQMDDGQPCSGRTAELAQKDAALAGGKAFAPVEAQKDLIDTIRPPRR